MSAYLRCVRPSITMAFGCIPRTFQVRGKTVPRAVDEGVLSASANAEIPGSVVRPGLEMVVEIDPGGTLDPALGLGGRIPETRRMALDVREVPPLDLTLVPLLWEEAPDRSILDETEGLSADDDLFWPVRDLLPVRDFSLRVRRPYGPRWILWLPTAMNYSLRSRRFRSWMAREDTTWASCGTAAGKP